MAKLSKPKKVVKSVAKAVKKVKAAKPQNKPAAGHKVIVYQGAKKSVPAGVAGGRKQQQPAKGRAPRTQAMAIIKQPTGNRSGSAKKGVAGGKAAPKGVTIVKQDNLVRPAAKKAQTQQPKAAGGGRGGARGGGGGVQGNGLAKMNLPKMGGGNFPSSGQSTAIQTAQVVAQNKSHAKHREVNELLQTLQKGWIDQRKFADLLQGILF